MAGHHRSVDVSSPLVLDVRELGRRAGAMITIDRTVPAPAELTNPMIGIPQGSELELDVMAESVIEGVWVSGTVSAELKGECGRCLEPVSEPITVEVQELFQYDDRDAEDRDEELPSFDSEYIDIEPTVRDAVVLALPLAPVCEEECQGLCSECGIRLLDEPGHKHDQLDPRWAALGTLLAPSEEQKTNATAGREANETPIEEG